MLDFYREVLGLTVAPDADLSPPCDSLRTWIEELLTTRVSLGAGKGEGTLVDQIINQLDVLQERMSGLLRSGAGTGQQYEMLSFRVAALRSEQCKLAGILASISEAVLLGRSQVLRLLKWLKNVEKADVITTTVLA
jgi:nuclear pore complex protein Nup205